MTISRILVTLFCFVSAILFADQSDPIHKIGPLSEKELEAVQVIQPTCWDKIEKLKTLPKISLIGEKRHGSEESHAKRKEKIDDARDGKCIVGLEGVFCSDANGIEKYTIENAGGPKPKDNEVLFGYDDQVAHGISTLFSFHTSGVVDLEEKNWDGLQDVWDDLVLNARLNPVLVDSFLKYYAQEEKSGFPHGRDALMHLKTQIVDGKPEILEGMNASDAARHLATLASIPYALEGWTYTTIDSVTANETKSKEMFMPQDLRKIADENFQKGMALQTVQKLVVDWRNLLMARNLVAAYCKALESGVEPKDLVVISGDAHLPGLERLLTAIFKGKVKIELEHEKDQMADLMQEYRRVLGELKSEGRMTPSTGTYWSDPLGQPHRDMWSLFNQPRPVISPEQQAENEARHAAGRKWAAERIKKADINMLVTKAKENAAKVVKDPAKLRFEGPFINEIGSIHFKVLTDAGNIRAEIDSIYYDRNGQTGLFTKLHESEREAEKSGGHVYYSSGSASYMAEHGKPDEETSILEFTLSKD